LQKDGLRKFLLEEARRMEQVAQEIPGKVMAAEKRIVV
jgi:hypothetical protein